MSQVKASTFWKTIKRLSLRLCANVKVEQLRRGIRNSSLRLPQQIPLIVVVKAKLKRLCGGWVKRLSGAL